MCGTIFFSSLLRWYCWLVVMRLVSCSVIDHCGSMVKALRRGSTTATVLQLITMFIKKHHMAWTICHIATIFLWTVPYSDRFTNAWSRCIRRRAPWTRPCVALGWSTSTCVPTSWRSTMHSPRKTRGGRERAAVEFLKNGSGRVSSEWINDRDMWE